MSLIANNVEMTEIQFAYALSAKTLYFNILLHIIQIEYQITRRITI